VRDIFTVPSAAMHVQLDPNPKSWLVRQLMNANVPTVIIHKLLAFNIVKDM